MKQGIFISHIGEEKLLALRTKELLREALGEDVKVFVSSDYDSIRSGADWHGDIIATPKTSAVVLILCSPDSVQRPWINYEAGVGDGTDWDVGEVGSTHVVPVVVRGPLKGQLQQPLSRKHARDTQDAADITALLSDIAAWIGTPVNSPDIDTFIADLNALAQRTSVRDERLSMPAYDFETYIKGLITTENENEFLVLLKDLREQTVDCWGVEWPDTAEATADRVREVKDRFLAAMHKLTLLGVLLVKYSRRQWLVRVAHCLERIFKVSNSLGRLPNFYQPNVSRQKNKLLNEHLSHTVPALEALLSLYLIGGYAVTRRLVEVQAFFPCVVPVAAGPHEADSAHKRPLLFWPITLDYGYPEAARADLIMERYGHSERIGSLFGGKDAIKAAVLQQDCYVAWNSFICVQPPVVKEITEYLQQYCRDISLVFCADFIAERFGHVAPIIETLWNLAGSEALDHLNGFTLDTNMAQRLVNMGPENRREIFANFVLYAQKQRGIYHSYQNKFPEFFSWSTGLTEAVRAAKPTKTQSKGSSA